MGAVQTVDAAAKKLTIKSDAGDSYAITITSNAKVQKIAPGSKDPEPLTFEEIAVGDRAVAYGTVSAEAKTVGASRLVVMTKGDLAKKDDMIKAMEKADFASVRGPYRYGNNHFPIQNFYLQDVVKGPDATPVLKTVATIVKDDQDGFHDKCQMK